MGSGDYPGELAERIAFGTAKLWALHVIVLFAVLLLPGSWGNGYANALSVIRYGHSSGFLACLERAIVATAVPGVLLGLTGVMAARSALRVSNSVERAVLALGLNIAIAGLMPLAIMMF